MNIESADTSTNIFVQFLVWLNSSFTEPVWGALTNLVVEPWRYFGEWAWQHPAYYLIFPEIFLAVFVAIILILDLVYGNKYYEVMIWLLFAGLLINFLMTIHLMFYTSRYFTYGLGTWWGGLETVDPFAIFFKQLLDWGDFPLVLMMFAYGTQKDRRTEYLILFGFATIAFDLMVGSSDLLAIFVMTEFSSICLYMMTCSYNRNIRSLEAALKFFLTGSSSTASMLFSLSLIYGVTGSTNLYDLSQNLQSMGNSYQPLIIIGVLFFVIGLGYKIGVAPFHMYIPDTYEGAPTVVTTFLAIFPKIAGIGVIMRIFLLGFYHVRDAWIPMFWVIAVLSMFIGNIMAMKQTSFRRFMGYSGIAHMGFIVAAVMCAVKVPEGTQTDSQGFNATLYYLVIFTFMNLGLFLGFMMNESSGGDDRLETLNGLHRRNPVVAFLMTVCSLALMGMPPTAGFIAKFLIYKSVYVFIATEPWMFVLLIILAINTLLGFYYYYHQLIRRFYVLEPISEILTKPFYPIFYQRIALLFSTLVVFMLGWMFVQSIYDYVDGAWFLEYFSKGMSA